MAYFKAALYGTQQAQEEYFGNVSPNAEQTIAHDVLLNKPGVNSVADFKNIGLCVQRSAVANNMLQVLGVPTTLTYGGLSIGGGTRFGHTFLLVKTPKGGTRLYDPMNPTHLYDDESRHIASRPRYSKVPAEAEDSGRYETDMRVGVQMNGEYQMAKVPVTYHLKTDRESVSAMIKWRQLLTRDSY